MVTMTPDMLRHLRRIGLFAGFGLLVFVVALYMSFPYERAKEAAIRMASKNLDMDVEIGSAGPAFGLAVVFQDIRVRTRPADGQADPVHDRFGEVLAVARSALFTVVVPVQRSRWTRSAARSSSISRARRARRAPFRTELSARDIDMAEIPGVKEAINMPLGGKLKLELRDRVGDRHATPTPTASISLTCAECVAGDGKTPLKVRGQRVPVRRADAAAHAPRAIWAATSRSRRGRRSCRGWRSKSPDGEVALEGEIDAPRSAVVRRP